jgi:hypothetical protein
MVGCIFGLAIALPGGSPPVLAEGPELRILFIGNSLTAANELPAILEGLVRTGGTRPLDWKAVLLPGASLEDQWQAGEAQRAIGSQRWDVVVLQQGPSPTLLPCRK